jgi:hypothetical protein
MGDSPRVAFVLLLILGCSSSKDGAPDGSPAASPDVAVIAPADAASTMVDQAPGTAVDQAPGNVTDVKASEECVKYCTCMAKNCADKMFPTGCLPACAAQTKWDIPCRQNMCNLVPAQPDNDHCTHAFGMFQCTDRP